MRYLSFARLLLMLWFGLASYSVKAQTPLKDLPLQEFKGNSHVDKFILYLTGDGGWNDFSQQLVKDLRDEGHSVVVFDSRKYFWKSKTPEKFAHDIARVIEHYFTFWQLDKVSIVGYSFGADVSAFLPTALPQSMVQHLQPLILLSPSRTTDFEIHLSDLISGSSGVERKYNVEQAIKASHISVWCVFGQEEELLLKEKLSNSEHITVKILPGSHHYNNNVAPLVKLIQGVN